MGVLRLVGSLLGGASPADAAEEQATNPELPSPAPARPEHARSVPPPAEASPKTGGEQPAAAAPDSGGASVAPTPRLGYVRRWPRIKLAVQVRLSFDSFGPAIEARVLNASERGLFLAMEQSRPIGTEMEITIDIAEPLLHVTVRGVVVHVVESQPSAIDPSGVGVFLTQTNPTWSKFCRRMACAKEQGHKGTPEPA